MNKNLYEVIASVLNVPDNLINPDAGPLSLPEWDSLAHVSIISAIEGTFLISLTMKEILNVKTVRDLEIIIESRKG